MAEEKTSKLTSMVPEVKREILSILVESGMEPDLIDAISLMDSYKVQVFLAIYQAYSSRPDLARERAEDLLKADEQKLHIRALLEKEDNKALWDRKKFLDKFAFDYYRRNLVMEFLKTGMHEYMNTLASSSDRSSFILTKSQDRVRIV